MSIWWDLLIKHEAFSWQIFRTLGDKHGKYIAVTENAGLIQKKNVECSCMSYDYDDVVPFHILVKDCPLSTRRAP